MMNPDNINSRLENEINPSEKTVPRIAGEEDVPFPTQQVSSSQDHQGIESKISIISTADDNLSKTDDLDAEITRFRYKTGKTVLFVAMGAMVISVLIDIIISLIPNAQSALLTNAFEAFKLITMTVLGYIFGSNGTSNSK